MGRGNYAEIRERKLLVITPDEIRRTISKTKIGDTVKILDSKKIQKRDYGFGVVVKAHVLKKYPHLVTLDNGMSATYVQLAMFYRSGKKGYIQ